MSPDGSEVLGTAETMRWSAPEITVTLAEHGARSASATGQQQLALTAWGLALHGRSALGEGLAGLLTAADAVGGLQELRGELAGQRLLLEVAAVARQVGELPTARALLTEVFGQGVEPSAVLAEALTEAARCAAADPQGDVEGVEALLEQAREVAGMVGGDVATIGGAASWAVAAADARQRGLNDRAVDAAREGQRLLAGGGVPPTAGADAGHLATSEAATSEAATQVGAPRVAATLSLELVLALLANGQPDDARDAALQALGSPAQPASAEPLGWLRLALARHLCRSGERDAARESVEAALRSLADRELPELEARCASLLGELHESAGDLAAALAAERRAHDADRRHSSVHHQVRLLLARAYVPAVDGTATPAAPVRQHADPVPAPEPAPARADELAGEQGQPPLSAVVIDVERPGWSTSDPERAHELLVRIGAKAFGALPAGGHLHPLDGDAIVVVLPGLDHAAAEQWAHALRGDLAASWADLAGTAPSALRVAVAGKPAGQPIEWLIGELRESLRPGLHPTGSPAARDGGPATVPMAAVGSAEAEEVVTRRLSLRYQWANATGAGNGSGLDDGAASPGAQGAGHLVRLAEATELTDPTEATDGADADDPPPRIGELSFAELLAGALAEYRGA